MLTTFTIFNSILHIIKHNVAVILQYLNSLHLYSDCVAIKYSYLFTLHSEQITYKKNIFTFTIHETAYSLAIYVNYI